jgi:hypothetical protein|tara:strand:- start:538 stop:774 length:237 start_codon:yes stop_codon:yes gene_type:complete
LFNFDKLYPPPALCVLCTIDLLKVEVVRYFDFRLVNSAAPSKLSADPSVLCCLVEIAGMVDLLFETVIYSCEGGMTLP